LSDSVVSDKAASAKGKRDPGGRQVYRSPVAVAAWWLWALFAAANLIDLAVQGRDHLSLVAAFILLFVTGILYVTAKRPRIIAGTDGLTIANPLRDHRVDWAAVAGADPGELLRVRCEWPDGDGTARRAIYAWAVHSSRRRPVAAEMRRQSQPQGSPSRFGAGGFGSSQPATEGDPLRLDVSRVVATLTERGEKARLDAPAARPPAPVSTWDLTAVAAVVVPGLALLIAALL
jgi:Bacterial PH domain